jgi:hypothetical protein
VLCAVRAAETTMLATETKTNRNMKSSTLPHRAGTQIERRCGEQPSESLKIIFVDLRGTAGANGKSLFSHCKAEKIGF